MFIVELLDYSAETPLSQLLQASDHPGLQVQNLAGEWIDAPPIPGTFVVNMGKGMTALPSAVPGYGMVTHADGQVLAALETVTQGLARATSHRVLSPVPGSTPRYSIPFFQNIAQGICIGDLVLKCKVFAEESILIWHS